MIQMSLMNPDLQAQEPNVQCSSLGGKTKLWNSNSGIIIFHGLVVKNKYVPI